MQNSLSLVSEKRQIPYRIIVFITFCLGIVVSYLIDDFPLKIVAGLALPLLSALCLVVLAMSASLFGLYLIPLASAVGGLVCGIVGSASRPVSADNLSALLPLLLLVPILFLVSAHGMSASAMITAELKKCRYLPELNGILLPQILLAAFSVLIALTAI